MNNPDTHEIIRAFEKMTDLRIPGIDLSKNPSGAYKNHLTYHCFIAFCSGWEAKVISQQYFGM